MTEKKVCVYQPGYFQPLHYFARIYESDVFVSLAGAQLVRKQGQNKAKLYDCDLIVPVEGGHRQPLNKAVPCYADRWVSTHLRTLKHVYGKAPFYDDTMALIRPILRYAEKEKWVLAKLGLVIVDVIMERVRWHGTLYEEAWRPEGVSGSDWMLKIVLGYGGNVYVCGKTSAESYLKLDDFASKGIVVKVQDWKCPEYKQKGKQFKPNLSVLDALMYCGIDEFVSVLKGEQ